MNGGIEMATYYGQVKGYADITASRRGSKESDIKASCQSWDGSLITSMWYRDGRLMVLIETAEGSSFKGERTLFRGTFQQLCERLGE